MRLLRLVLPTLTFWLCLSPAPLAAQEMGVTAASPEARALFDKARNLAENMHDGEALKVFREAVQKDPKFALAHAYLGVMQAGKEGAESLQVALALSAGVPNAERLYIEALYWHRQEDLDKAQALLEDLQKRVPNDWRVELFLGSLAYQRRDWRKSNEAFARSLAKKKTCTAYNSLAYGLGMMEDYRGAVSALLRCAELQPEEPNSHDSIGDMYLAAGQFDKAEESFRKALAVSNRFYPAMYGVATTQLLRGQWEAGKASLKAARGLAEQPQDIAVVEVYQGWALFSEGKHEEALAFMHEMAKRGHVQGSGYEQVLATLNLSMMYEELGRHDDAITLANQTAERATAASLPRPVMLTFRRGALLRRLLAESRAGHPVQAARSLALLETEVEKSPGNIEAQSALRLARGTMLLAKDDWEGAKKEFSRCHSSGLSEWSFSVTSKPEDPYCLWQLAKLQMKLGEGKASRASILKRRLSRDPMALYLYWQALRQDATAAAR